MFIRYVEREEYTKTSAICRTCANSGCELVRAGPADIIRVAGEMDLEMIAPADQQPSLRVYKVVDCPEYTPAGGITKYGKTQND